MYSPAANSPCKLFVGGLSAQTTTEMLRGHFAKYGRIVDVVVMSKQGRPRGFGFVAFDTPAAAALALSEPQRLGDRFVDVKAAVPGEQPAERAPNKIFVGGLPQDATTEDLRACFAQYGPIADAVVMVDRRTRRSRGFGFIRFAGGAQGAMSAEMVVQNASNHWLGNKWIEVKRATPAALLQDLSPSSGAASSPSCTPTHHQRFKEEENILAPWLHRPAAGLATPSPQHQEHRQRSSYFGLGDANACGMYSPHWNPAALAGHFGGFGMPGWETSAEFSPVFSPLRHFAGFTPAMLETTPLTAGGSLDPSFHIGEDAGASDSYSSSHGSDAGGADENKPAAANRAVTPPPGRFSKKPVAPLLGLGIEASPMKVEFPSKSFEGLGAQGGFGGSALQDSVAKGRSLPSAKWVV